MYIIYCTWHITCVHKQKAYSNILNIYSEDDGYTNKRRPTAAARYRHDFHCHPIKQITIQLIERYERGAYLFLHLSSSLRFDHVVNGGWKLELPGAGK